MRLALLMLLLAACDGRATVQGSDTVIGLVFTDDADAGVRCYGWDGTSHAISCVKVR